MIRRFCRAASLPLLLLGLGVVCMLPGCGDGDRHDDGAATALLDGSIELPRVVHHGATPPLDERITLAIRADGGMWLRAGAGEIQSVDYKTFENALRALLGVGPIERRYGGSVFLDEAKDQEDVLEAWEDTEEVADDDFEEDTEEVVPESEIVLEEPVIKDEDLAETPGLSDADKDDPRKAELQRANPKQQVVDLPPRDPVAREQAPRDDRLRRRRDLLLQVDRRVPFVLIQRVLWACAHPRVALARLFVAVRPESAEEPAAIAVFIPEDAGLCGGRIVAGTDVQVHLRRGTRADPAGALAAALVRRRERADEPLFVSLAAPDDTPWGRLIACVDEALAAGAYSFVFDGSLSEQKPRTLEAWIQASRSREPLVAWILEPALEAHAPAPDVPRGAHPGYFGFGNEVTMGVEEPIIQEHLADKAHGFPVRTDGR